MSLTDKIRNATTRAEVDSLLKEGAGYQYATNYTRNRWNRFATQAKAKLHK